MITREQANRDINVISLRIIDAIMESVDKDVSGKLLMSAMGAAVQRLLTAYSDAGGDAEAWVALLASQIAPKQ